MHCLVVALANGLIPQTRKPLAVTSANGTVVVSEACMSAP